MLMLSKVGTRSERSAFFVMNGSAASRRIEASLDEFRRFFPAALCYTKIVPVDEVVTLTLFHREDGHLKRLMLEFQPRFVEHAEFP